MAAPDPLDLRTDPCPGVHVLLAAFRRGERSPVDIVDNQLARIEEAEPSLNAFVALRADEARAEAQASAQRWAEGRPVGDLDGIPITIKDLVAVAGLPTRSGSTTSSDVPADADDPVAARLREAGAVVLGKTTTSEFGWKGITDTPAHGTTRNPWNLDHSPGGSSGGAAASLAAGIGAVAHGNDGGGSVRIPSAYCGHYGIKPTFGRVPQPNDGSFSTLSANGPLARSVADAALVLNVMSRPDGRDWMAVPHDGRDWRFGLEEGLGGLRVAYTDTLGGAEASSVVGSVCRAAIDALADVGVQVTEVGSIFEPLRPKLEAYWKAGFAATLRTIGSDRWSELDAGFRTLAQEGLAVDAAAIEAGHQARAELALTMSRFHADHDVLLTPTTPTPAPAADIVYHSADFDRWDHAVAYTVPFNYSRQPAGSAPVGLAPTSGGDLPVGLQVVADRWREDLVLRGMRAIEATIGFPQEARPVTEHGRS